MKIAKHLKFTFLCSRVTEFPINFKSKELYFSLCKSALTGQTDLQSRDIGDKKTSLLWPEKYGPI